MYVSLERVCIFGVGSGVGSSGIQFVTIQEMCVSLERVCIFKVGSSGIHMSLFRKCWVCLKRQSGGMVGQIFFAFGP